MLQAVNNVSLVYKKFLYLFSSFGNERVAVLKTKMSLWLASEEAELAVSGITGGVGDASQGVSHVDTLEHKTTIIWSQV